MDMARMKVRIDNKTRRSCERMKRQSKVATGSRLNCLSLTRALLPFRSRHRSPLYSPSFLSLPRLTRRSSRLHFIVCSHTSSSSLLAPARKQKKQKCEAMMIHLARHGSFCVGKPRASGRIWLPLYLGSRKYKTLHAMAKTSHRNETTSSHPLAATLTFSVRPIST